MAISCNKKVGAEICEILGLNPMKTRKVTLVFESNSIVMADAAIYVETEEYDKITPILKKYKMVPIVDVVDVTPLGSETKVWARAEDIA
jgi:hypothetical protein